MAPWGPGFQGPVVYTVSVGGAGCAADKENRDRRTSRWGPSAHPLKAPDHE